MVEKSWPVPDFHQDKLSRQVLRRSKWTIRKKKNCISCCWWQYT